MSPPATALPLKQLLKNSELHRLLNTVIVDPHKNRLCSGCCTGLRLSRARERPDAPAAP
jgi:hypothetical protein